MFNPLESYTVLLILLISQITRWIQFQSIVYSYGYVAMGDNAGSPLFEIAKTFPQLDTQYALLIGPLYTIPFAISSLFIGELALKQNRRNLLAVSIGGSAATLVVSALTDSYPLFAAMRILEGCFSAGITPLVYTILDDYFPLEKRTQTSSAV